MKLVSGFCASAVRVLAQRPHRGRQEARGAHRSQAQARQRQSTKYEKKKSSSVAVLPGKLTDCESDDISMNELFIVEGDFCRRLAKSGRNKEFQAVLPLRGKILNTWEVDADKIFGSDTVHDIAVAIGVDPHPADGAPRPQGTALRQDLHFVRCRRGRQSHSGAASHALLPSLPEAYRTRACVRGHAAPLSRRRAEEGPQARAQVLLSR